jgi:cell division septum initiation protein DivIVA
VSLFEQAEGPSAEDLLRSAIATVRQAKNMPLSANALVSRDELVALLEQALARVPDEVRHARWMLREREDFLSKTHREAEDILEASRVRAESMVQRSEIVRQAQHAAQRVVDRAHDEARRLRRETEDYCDRKLSSFEDLLERTAKTVESGRRKLQETPAWNGGGSLVSFGAGAVERNEQPDANGADRDEGEFFDQDRT